VRIYRFLIGEDKKVVKGRYTMKRGQIVIILFLSVLLFAGCSNGLSSYYRTSDTPPSGDAAEFWTLITKTSPYKNWKTWPGYPDMYPGKSPHGAFLMLYANDIAIDAVKAGKVTMPNGAILVKENYGKDKKTLMSLTPMYKIDGYNPEGGNWYWAKYGPKGKVEAAGKLKGCIGCHKIVKQKDWLYTSPKM
jgi:hypothetical protein